MITPISLWDNGAFVQLSLEIDFSFINFHLAIDEDAKAGARLKGCDR